LSDHFLTFFQQDILSDDEIIADTLKIIDAGNGLWEVDGRMVKKGADNFGQSFELSQERPWTWTLSDSYF
jgi:hypothetical protein